MNKPSASSLVACVTAAIILAGCATKDPYVQADGYYCGGSYESAAECIKDAEQPDSTSGHVLDNLYVGSAHFAAQGHDAAIADFTAAEAGLKEQDLQSALGKGFGSVADVFATGSGTYYATTYDETMMNFYQALSYLAKGKIDRARVEFNRVYVRQGRAADRNSALIRARQESLAKVRTDARNADAQKATKDASFDGGIELSRELERWNAYADYMNPAAVFMCGVYRLLWGGDMSDCAKGITYFKRAYGMQPTKVAEQCVRRLENAENGKGLGDDFVLVLFENGMGPQKVEERKEIIIPYRYPIHVGVALPMLQHRPQAYASLAVYDGATCIGTTETICDFDRVVAAEFREELKWATASAFVGATIRVGIQIVAMEALRIELDKQVSDGKMSAWERDLALLAGGSALSAASAVTTHADTRIWSTLPHDYQAAIVPRPASGNLLLKTPTGSTIADVALPKTGGSAFAYIKIPTSGSSAIAFAVPGR